MPHDWVDLALGIVVSACGWLIVRLVGRIDTLEGRSEERTAEIAETRQAVCRLEGYLHIEPHIYKT